MRELVNTFMEKFGLPVKYIVIIVSMYLGYWFLAVRQKQPDQATNEAMINTNPFTIEVEDEEYDETDESLPPRDFDSIYKELLKFLEVENLKGCDKLIRKYSNYTNVHFAYANVLLQFLLWQKGDVDEVDVQKALFHAIDQNTFVPQLIISKKFKESTHQYISPGEINEAEDYVGFSRKLWKKHSEARRWMKKQRYMGGYVPKEKHLIKILQSGATFQIHCIHTNLNGGDKRDAPFVGTQKRKKCFGHACKDFIWPRELNQKHEKSTDIFVHQNITGDEKTVGEDDSNGWPYWRKTKYVDIKGVPFWSIVLQFCEDNISQSDSESEEAIVKESKKKIAATSINCFKCGQQGKMCVLCNKGATFFCSETCMKDELVEDERASEPISFKLDSNILKITASRECELDCLDIDEVLSIAADHMPNLKGVDIFIEQTFVLPELFEFSSESSDSLQLSSLAFLEFFQKVHTKLESFSLRVGDCCWDEMKKLTDNGRAFLPLGVMPNLKKLTLGGMGFDDITILTSSLNPKLKYLELDNMMTISSTWCIPEAQALAGKLSQLTDLVTLSIPDHGFEDDDLINMLPHLQNLRNLNFSGRFGQTYDIRHSMLTDKGLMAIAQYCPKLQSLDVSYNRKATARGVKAVIMKCQDLVDLEVAGLGISAQNVATLLSLSRNILFFCFEGCRGHEEYLLHDAMKASKGKVIISGTHDGMYEVQLSPDFQKSRDESMDKITKAYEQQSKVDVYNRWDGLI